MTTALASKGRRTMGIALALALALGVAGLPATGMAAVRAKSGANGRILTIVGDRNANEVAVTLNVVDETIDVTAGTAAPARRPSPASPRARSSPCASASAAATTR